MDVVHSLNDANLIIPAGDAKIGDTDYFITTNSMIEDPDGIDDVPVKVGRRPGAGAGPRRRPRRGRRADPAERGPHRRPALGLRAGAEAGQRQHHRGRGRRARAAAEGRRPAGRDASSAPSSISRATSAAAIAQPRARGRVGRGAGLAGDPALPRQLQVDPRDLRLDPALDPGGGLRPLPERLDDQRDDPRRLRARDRPAGGRLGGRAREHQPPPGAGQEPAAGGARRRGGGGARRCWRRPSRPSSSSSR